MTINHLKTWLCSVGLATLLLFSMSSQAATDTEEHNLDTKIQNLKKDVLAINRELFTLEEELLFPSSTQIAVFVSLDVGEYFTLDSVQLKIDNDVVASYLYTEREIRALVRGGIQRLYTGNLRTGDHEIVAIFVGIGPSGREYKRATELTIDKRRSPKYLELKITDTLKKQQPEFSIKEW